MGALGGGVVGVGWFGAGGWFGEGGRGREIRGTPALPHPRSLKMPEGRHSEPSSLTYETEILARGSHKNGEVVFPLCLQTKRTNRGEGTNCDCHLCPAKKRGFGSSGGGRGGEGLPLDNLPEKTMCNATLTKRVPSFSHGQQVLTCYTHLWIFDLTFFFPVSNQLVEDDVCACFLVSVSFVELHRHMGPFEWMSSASPWDSISDQVTRA